MYREKETIKCETCGYDTGIPINGPFMRVIPPEGLKCYCGRILVFGNKVELDGQDYRKRTDYSFKHIVDINEGKYRYLCKDLSYRFYC